MMAARIAHTGLPECFNFVSAWTITYDRKRKSFVLSATMHGQEHKAEVVMREAEMLYRVVNGLVPRGTLDVRDTPLGVFVVAYLLGRISSSPSDIARGEEEAQWLFLSTD